MNSSEQMVNADPNGDVRFLIGDPDNANTLRVSSKVLSLASPVFAALFSPKYAEGIALSKSTEVRQIGLPEDDPEALKLICHVLHHQRVTPHQISFELLEKAAIICDKYDLATVLTPWTGLWMQQWKSRGDGSAYWSKMLCLSSIFDSHEAFYLSSAKLMSSCFAVKPSLERRRNLGREFSNAEDLSNCLDICVSSTSQGVYSIAGMPERLYRKWSNSILGSLADRLRRYQGSIFYKREAVTCALHEAIEDIIDQPVDDGRCPKEAYHSMQSLRMVGLWPLSKRLHSSTLQEVLKDLREFSRCQGYDDCNCDDYVFGNDVESAANDVGRELKGLCLTCFKKGRATWEEGNCSAGTCKIVQEVFIS